MTEANNPERPVPVHEIYRGYRPPIDAARVVTRLLRSVPRKYLRGLSCIVLTNQSGLSRRDRIGKVWRKKRKVKKDGIVGRYHPRWQGQPPWIELYVDRMLGSNRGALLWLPLFREVVFGSVLYHELGHHIHYEIRPEYEDKEDTADKWSRRLGANHLKTTYWYLMLVLVPIAKLYQFFKKKYPS